MQSVWVQPLPSLLASISGHVRALQREGRIREKEGIAFLALLPEAERGGRDQNKTTIKKVVSLPLIYLSTEDSKEKLTLEKNLMIN